MKKILVCLFIFSFFNTYSQITFGKEGTFANNWHEGKLVLKNKDTLKGLVKFQDISKNITGFSLSNKVKFKENETSKKDKFKRKKIDYFEVINNSGEKVKYTYKKVKLQGLKLLKIEEEGKVSLYTDKYSYWTSEPVDMYKSGISIYVQKEGEKKVNDLFLPNAFSSFKKNAKKYFADCASLVQGLENGKYKRKDFREIVKIYNSCQ